MDEKFILKQIKRRHHSGYKMLFDHLYLDLVVYASNYLFDKASSEDVVQEVFLHLWDHDVNIKTSLKSYLFAMVRYKCIDILKSINLTDDLNLLDLNANLITEQSSNQLLEDEENKLLYNRVMRVVGQLPDQMRKVFELKFLDNLDNSEIAEVLNISINSVRTQLRRAKKKINQLISFVSLLLGFFAISKYFWLVNFEQLIVVS